MKFNDRLGIDSERVYTDEGFLTVPARIARTGIQEYLAIEFGLKDRDPMDVIRVYRPEDEVFNEDSLKSFTNKPVTDNHPDDLVSSKNAKELSVGHSGPEVTRDGIFAKTILHITDDEAIKKIESGKVELSNGYTSDIEWTSGITPDGEQYDAIQRNIKGNHIAIVNRGRCGSACRVSDNSPDETEEKPMAKLTIDGVDYEASEQVVQAVDKVLARLTDAENEAQEAKEKAKEAEDEMEEAEKEAKKTEDSLRAKLDDAKSKIPGPELLDQLVENRMNTRDAALAIVPDFEYKNKDCEQIRREIVESVCTDIDVSKMSADYIRARFDALSASPQTSMDRAVRDSIKNPPEEDNRPESVKARDKFMADSRNAWKKGGK